MYWLISHQNCVRQVPSVLAEQLSSNRLGNFSIVPVCVCSHVCDYVCMCWHTGVSRKFQDWCQSGVFLIHYALRQGLLLTLELVCLACLFPGSPLLLLSVRIIPSPLLFMWVLGIWTLVLTVPQVASAFLSELSPQPEETSAGVSSVWKVLTVQVWGPELALQNSC